MLTPLASLIATVLLDVIFAAALIGVGLPIGIGRVRAGSSDWVFDGPAGAGSRRERTEAWREVRAPSSGAQF